MSVGSEETWDMVELGLGLVVGERMERDLHSPKSQRTFFLELSN